MSGNAHFKDSFYVYEEHILAVWFEIFLNVSADLLGGADSHTCIGTGFLMVEFVRCVDAHAGILDDVKYFRIRLHIGDSMCI